MSRTWQKRGRWKAEHGYAVHDAPRSVDRDPDRRCVRFAVEEWSRNSGWRLGIVRGASRRLREGAIAPRDRREVRRLLDWFNAHLPMPDRFSPYKDGHRRVGYGEWRKRPIAISWFRPDATAYVRRARQLAEIVARNGTVVREMQSLQPGYVTYEDHAQVVAVPFADTTWSIKVLNDEA